MGGKVRTELTTLEGNMTMSRNEPGMERERKNKTDRLRQIIRRVHYWRKQRELYGLKYHK